MSALSESKWSRRKAAMIALATFAFGVLLGPGALWQLPLAREAQQRQKEIYVLQLSTAATERFDEAVTLFGEYVADSNRIKLIEANRGWGQGPAVVGGELQTQWKDYSSLKYDCKRARQRIEILMEDFNRVESTLARIERRSPRALPIGFSVPEAPTGLRVSSVQYDAH